MNRENSLWPQLYHVGIKFALEFYLLLVSCKNYSMSTEGPITSFHLLGLIVMDQVSKVYLPITNM